MTLRPALSILAGWLLLAFSLSACQNAASQAPTLTASPAGLPTPTPHPTLPPAAIAPTHPQPARSPTPTLLPTAAQGELSPILLPFPPATVTKEVVDVWDDPQYENAGSHRQTQLILGEQVLVVQARGEWAEIRAVEQPSHKDPLGYPGWVRRSGLADGWPVSDQRLVVMAPSAPVLAQPQAAAARLVTVSLGSNLVVLSQEPGWVSVRLPDGRAGWLESRAARLANVESPAPAGQALLDTARALLGLPYLWGGTAPAAYDCSGFVYRVFSAHGVKIARDSQDQALLGIPADSKSLQPGDLLFYSAQAGSPISHVALYVGNGQVIDAQTSGGVELRPMAELLNTRVFAGARRLQP